MSTDPSWDLYRTFEAVLRHGSMSAAARVLGLTQPTVSRQIDTLEATLGVQLFVRNQRGLIPTATALRLAPYVETLCETTAALVRYASLANVIDGTVRITASETVAIEYLPPVLAGLRRDHPSLHLELSVSDTVEDLMQGQADIAVRMIEPTQKTFVKAAVNTIEFGLYAHASYLERQGVPRELSDLINFDVVGFDTETPAIRTASEPHLWLRRRHFALRTDNSAAQLAAIRSGFGVGYCQTWVADRTPGLVRVLEAQFALRYTMWVAMHQNLLANAACQTVYEGLSKGLSSLH